MKIVERLSTFTKSQEFRDAASEMQAEVGNIQASVEALQADLVKAPFEGAADRIPKIKQQLAGKRDDIALLTGLAAEADRRADQLAHTENEARLDGVQALADQQLVSLAKGWDRYERTVSELETAAEEVIELMTSLHRAKAELAAGGRQLAINDGFYSSGSLRMAVRDAKAASAPLRAAAKSQRDQARSAAPGG